MRYFNTEGVCRPDVHYMVCLDDRLDKIKRLYVDQGKYFIINRGRQYGKTTTLKALAEYLKKDYVVIAMDFQMMSTANFANERAFARKFIGQAANYFSRKKELSKELDADALQEFVSLKTDEDLSVDMMFEGLSRICETSKKPIVLMVDEVDSASNNQVFIDFLAQLRGYYLDRENQPTFRSVILAGVYDIKNLKLKLRPDEEHQYNSPWNIAADFDVDMSFSAGQIEVMLKEYETDHHAGMETEAVAEEIYQYTSGYPYLVSAICKILDERLSQREKPSGDVWSKEGVTEAANILLKMNIPLFGSMAKQLDTYKDMRKMIEEAVYQGKRIPFIPTEKSINLGLMFCFLKEENGYVAVANRIFEMFLVNLFIAEEAVNSAIFFYGQGNKNRFIKDSHLDMYLVLEKFVEYFNDIYNENDAEFVESYGRKFFLLYLKPIINGAGNYYIEAQTRDAGRTDVVVDYLGEQFVVEMKIWRGNEYNERGEKQLAEYLDYYHQKKGYLLSFNFNKKKETGMKVITFGDKTIVEAVV
ncbi:MAG: AAA-like domain-containing protein [Lachnospiraceae bacterium]|nr:AAA-like domain-containing protein [Lachnospiraceae bacterium]